MKKTMVISFIAAAMLLILCTACHVAESHNEVLAQENTVNGGYTITDITDPVEVQSYIAVSYTHLRNYGKRFLQ